MSRKSILLQIEELQKSDVIFYATSNRPGMEASIDFGVFDHFVHHLDKIWKKRRGKITLILHTTGGNPSAAWRIINLLRSFCDELEVIVPVCAQSAGTLMCLGCDKIFYDQASRAWPN